MKLYYAPKTRVTRARWLLEELGAEYELIRLDMQRREHKRADYLAVHPRGKVPALVDGSATVIESLGICHYLAVRFPEKYLAPPVGSPHLAAYCQWMAFSMGTLEPAILEIYASKARHPEDLEHEEVASAKKTFREVANLLDSTLEGRPFLCGDGFSAADVMNGSLSIWARSIRLLDEHEHLFRWTESLSRRSAYRRAVAA